MGAVSKRRAVSIRGAVSDRGNTVHVGYSEVQQYRQDHSAETPLCTPTGKLGIATLVTITAELL